MAMSSEPSRVQHEQINSDEQLPIRIKHRLEADWIFVICLDNQECFEFLKRGDYKMTASHNNITRKCNIHQLDDHKMLVAYYRCTSKHCIQTEGDTCPHRNMVKKCQLEQKNYIYKVTDILKHPKFKQYDKN